MSQKSLRVGPIPDKDLSRRHFMWLSMASASALLLPGCGGGGSANSGGFTLAATPRVVPTGDLQNQINQYSQSVDNLSKFMFGQSDAYDALHGTGRAAAGAPASSIANVAKLAYSMVANRILYERLSNALVHLDDVSYLSDAVTTQNNLNGTAALRNPQWTAAAMENTVNLLKVSGGVQQLIQTIGVTQWAESIRNISDPTDRMMTYAIFGGIFNQWLDNLQAKPGSGITPDMKLDVSASMTNDGVSAQLQRVPDLVKKLTLSPGYRPTVSRASQGDKDSGFIESAIGVFRDSAVGAGVEYLKREITGSFYSFFQVAVQAGDTFVYYSEETFGLIYERVPLASAIRTATGDALAREAIKKGLGLLFDHFGGPQAGKIAECSGNIAGLVLDTFAAAEIIAAASCITVVGCLALGGVLGLQLGLGASDVAKCANDINNPKPERPADIADAAAKLDASKGTPQTRDIPALTNPAFAECDQLSRAGVSQSQLPVPGTDTPGGPDAGSIDPNTARQLICGAPQGRAAEFIPRTFRNAEIAGLGLLYDLGKRSVSTVAPTLSGGTLRFYRSDFATLIRREAGTTTVTVPSITSAQLLCTSPGFIPQRSAAPVDLTASGASLPDLQSISALGTGVGINVH